MRRSVCVETVNDLALAWASSLNIIFCEQANANSQLASFDRSFPVCLAAFTTSSQCLRMPRLSSCEMGPTRGKPPYLKCSNPTSTPVAGLFVRLASSRKRGTSVSAPESSSLGRVDLVLLAWDLRGFLAWRKGDALADFRGDLCRLGELDFLGDRERWPTGSVLAPDLQASCRIGGSSARTYRRGGDPASEAVSVDSESDSDESDEDDDSVGIGSLVRQRESSFASCSMSENGGLRMDASDSDSTWTSGIGCFGSETDRSWFMERNYYCAM